MLFVELPSIAVDMDGESGDEDRSVSESVVAVRAAPDRPTDKHLSTHPPTSPPYVKLAFVGFRFFPHQKPPSDLPHFVWQGRQRC
ncbi:hypothetical protein GE061_010647 [Apolygus lucorum]|uniref:Uncharacterized protein n=1 Tax=Apolygus lucorum TaxID=248454 RepID=A0A8S9XZA7_APOLU|nr:hypothetical protein GE061_010647 [Apolygus lucorum]